MVIIIVLFFWWMDEWYLLSGGRGWGSDICMYQPTQIFFTVSKHKHQIEILLVHSITVGVLLYFDTMPKC